MKQVFHTKLQNGRRVTIPAELCEKHGLRPGDVLVLEASSSGIVLRSLATVVQEVHAFFADLAPATDRLSDELSRDRRAESNLEDRVNP
jgi:bifunctional DNA-binding transcriptional regulator/antitoxin component of YhaV-PrlF toxin-antitoxin module